MINGSDMRDARKRIGKTQEQLAEEVNISPRKLSRFENGKSLARYNAFLKLLERLGLVKMTVSNKERGE